MKNYLWYLSILFFMHGVQNGSAQDKLANKNKSDAGEEKAYKDPSPLKGLQIRPPYTVLKVRQSQLLKVRYCFWPSLTGDDGAIAGFLFECDPNVELAPLLPILKVSKWSVNGIEGGNDRVGKIVANDINTATYTAPSVKPSDETIQVSAEIQTDGQGKTIVVAMITILDDLRVYYGTVEIVCSTPDFKYRAFGDILFKDSGQNSDSFTSIGGSLGYSYDAKDCTAVTGVLPLHGELSLWTEEEDQIMVGGNTHGISFFTDPFDVSCNGITIPNAVFSILTTCDENKNSSSDIDYREIWGEGTCGNVRIKWNLAKQ